MNIFVNNSKIVKNFISRLSSGAFDPGVSYMTAPGLLNNFEIVIIYRMFFHI